MMGGIGIVLALVLQGPQGEQSSPESPLPQVRTIAVDERLAEDARLRVGDTVVVAGSADSRGEAVVVGAITKRGTDPAEIARREYRVRLHLDHLQRLSGYADRVDRFAVRVRDARQIDSVARVINNAAFGFRAFPSQEIAVETSRTFQVVSRFHDAIGMITIVASAIFLLCIMLLKVDERRRDIAALRLIGISAKSIVRSIVLEATLVSLLGSALGVGLGALGAYIVNAYYQAAYRTPLVFALITPRIVGFAVALSVVLGIGVGLLAALRLVRRPPLALLGR